MNQTDRQQWRTKVETMIEKVQFLSYGCRTEEVQLEAVEDIRKLTIHLGFAKQETIEAQNEDAANEFLSWELFLQALASEVSMWIALRRSKSNEAWDKSVDAEMNYRLAGRVHEWGAAYGAYMQASRMNGLQMLVFPRPVFTSVGALVKRSQCSICESAYGECDHIAGRPYMGKLAVRLVTDAKLLEISIVDEPANKTARITTVPTDDGYRDFMSWRRVEVFDSTQKIDP